MNTFEIQLARIYKTNFYQYFSEPILIHCCFRTFNTISYNSAELFAGRVNARVVGQIVRVSDTH